MDFFSLTWKSYRVLLILIKRVISIQIERNEIGGKKLVCIFSFLSSRAPFSGLSNFAKSSQKRRKTRRRRKKSVIRKWKVVVVLRNSYLQGWSDVSPDITTGTKTTTQRPLLTKGYIYKIRQTFERFPSFKSFFFYFGVCRLLLGNWSKFDVSDKSNGMRKRKRVQRLLYP